MSERQRGKRAGAEVRPGGEHEPVTICGYESRYDRILETALNEYTDVPCSGYHGNGYNLALRVKEYREAHLLFLHDSRVPATNNLTGRLLRFIERKQGPAVSLRNIKSLELLCDNMGVLFLMRKEGDSLYDKVSTAFG